MSQLVLLAVAVTATVVGQRRLPLWLAPTVVAGIGLLTGVARLDDLRGAFDRLWAPLAFLLIAVPLAVELDRTGFFTSLASYVGAGSPQRLRLGLWILGAAVVTVFNLDAAVVLLTPLYVRIARRTGDDPLALGLIPALLASIASSTLPVSNLTNLIAADRLHLGVTDFLVHLGAPSLAAIAVGFVAFRRALPRPPATLLESGEPASDGLVIGGLVTVWLLAGFTFGDLVGVPAWVVALLALVGLVVRNRNSPLRHVPLDAALIALSLGVVAAAAGPHLPVDRLLSLPGAAGHAAVIAGATVAANAMNNLPALLVAAPALQRHPAQVWAVLLGVNIGPSLWIFGALSTLLWRSTMVRMGVEVTTRDYVRAGSAVGLPALLASGTVLILAR